MKWTGRSAASERRSVPAPVMRLCAPGEAGSRYHRRFQRSRQGELAPRVEINHDAARQYAEAAAELCERLSLEDAIPVSVLLALPGVSQLRDANLDHGEAGSGLVRALERAAGKAAV